MEITLIVAVTSNNGIGFNKIIPWNAPADMRHFKDYTMGKPVVMGRVTRESLPLGHLPGRDNYVMTHARTPGTCRPCILTGNDVIFEFNGVAYFIDTMRENGTPEICVIGGAQVYELFMPHATKIVMSVIPGEYECDVFFPELNHAEWYAAGGSVVHEWGIIKTFKRAGVTS